ncbi:hypothetical protein Ana3638_11915 [Anaerocolumna sedimenticola]|uniref:Uncharacterized protein n=1 Tax=Anaerocolumna sedimenticola TaxID=2696063 RepID=A0A6P1TNC3_9FIRM|nr:hypothetical protein [Anaerocolumna sedimenticola]QHQ61391.1 hypothetical protein Ana3638_11915 [Anaerocolumna sedimenticola]
MQNINFDDGYKEFSINGDENRVIRINPSDFGLIERFNKAIENIENELGSLSTDVHLDAKGDPIEQLKEAADEVAKARIYVNEQIDYIFNSPVSNAVFGNQSPLSSPGGIPLVERFLNVVGPIINDMIKADVKAREARIKKYTSQVKKK